MMVCRHGDWLSATIGDEVVMMSVDKGKYIGMNDVGGFIWGLLETPQQLDTIYARLQEEFDVSREVCRAEVDAFIEELVSNGAASVDQAIPA